MIVQQRLGANTTDIATAVRHGRRPSPVREPGLGVTIRDTGHVTAIETIPAPPPFPGGPYRRKERIPPGPATLRSAATLTGSTAPSTVIDLAAYEQAAKNRNILR